MKAEAGVDPGKETWGNACPGEFLAPCACMLGPTQRHGTLGIRWILYHPVPPFMVEKMQHPVISVQFVLLKKINKKDKITGGGSILFSRGKATLFFIHC